MSDKTKTSIVFTFLKILEIGSVFGLTIGTYFLGKLAKYFNINISKYTWINGILLLLLFTLSIILVFLTLTHIIIPIIKGFININWKWALILTETTEERKTREKKETENKKNEFIKQNGFWIGDKVKVKKAYYDSEKKYVGNAYKVKSIDKHRYDTYVSLENGSNRSFVATQLEPVKKRK